MGTEVDEIGPVDHLLVKRPHGHSTFSSGVTAGVQCRQASLAVGVSCGHLITWLDLPGWTRSQLRP